MKSLVLLTLLPVCLASAIVDPVVVKETKVNTGSSSQYRAQDSLGNYEFAYDESHAEGGSFRKEAGSAHGPVIGSYGLRDIDGRVRVVNYVADDAGFRAAIATNEPGIVPKAPAAVSITKPGATVVAAAPVAEVVAPAAAVVAPVAASVATSIASPAAAYVTNQAITAEGNSLGINNPLVASLATKIIAARPLAYTSPGAAVAVAQPAPVLYRTPIEPQIASPTEALIRSYATSIYGPSLLSAPSPIASNLVAAHHAPASTLTSAYQPPLAPLASLANPAVNYLPSKQSISHEGYYEPSLAYAHPSAWGYTLGLPSTWGYQMVYRRKK